MRVALAVHGWPPEGTGGTERSSRVLARALVRAGHEVSIVAGSLQRAAGDEVVVERELDLDEESGAELEVLRVRRPDLYFDHWHKSLYPAVSVELRRALREREVDVLHVHHWLRLSRDLVRAAALEGVPSVVTLHDAWVSCPVAFRVRPDTSATCEVPAGPHPCVACAGALAPRTPWVPTEEAWMAFSRRQQDLTRELELARVVTAPSAAHAAALEAWLGLAPGALEARVVSPARERCKPVSATTPSPPAVDGRLGLVSWAGLASHKGADLLLEALERAPLPGRVELTLVGAPVHVDFAHRLRNAAVGLEVRFAGPCEPHDLARAARGAHAFVTATRVQESYGLALDEALELGLPVVAPRTPAFEERFAHGSAALLFEPGDAGSLAAQLQRLLVERELWPRLVQGARERARALLDSDAVAARMVELYELAIQAAAPQVQEPEWFEARMAEEALRAWDASLSRCDAAQLGLEA